MFDKNKNKFGTYQFGIIYLIFINHLDNYNYNHDLKYKTI